MHRGAEHRDSVSHHAKACQAKRLAQRCLKPVVFLFENSDFLFNN
jgi:hypothetical protein